MLNELVDDRGRELAGCSSVGGSWAIDSRASRRAGFPWGVRLRWRRIGEGIQRHGGEETWVIDYRQSV